MAWILLRALEQAEKEGRRGRDGVPMTRGLRAAYADVRNAHHGQARRSGLGGRGSGQVRHLCRPCGYDPWHMRDVPTVEAYEDYFGADNLQRSFRVHKRCQCR